MQKSKYRTGATHTREVVDMETGEVVEIDVKKHGYIANSKEEFLMLYSSVLGVFMHMEQSEIRVYGYLLQYADGLKFTIGKALRTEIASTVGLGERTVYNTLQVLKSKALIFEKDGLYQINPRYAFKGSSLERSNRLKAIIELGCKDC